MRATINILKIVVGLIILLTVIIGYSNTSAPLYEFTCITNCLCSAVLCIDGVLSTFYQTSLPQVLYDITMACANTVLCTLAFELSGYNFFNFQGAFVFLHAINLILFLCLYLTQPTCQIKFMRLVVAPIGVILYALFDVIQFTFTGKLIYGLISPDAINCCSILVIGVLLYLFEVTIMYGVASIQQGLHTIQHKI